MSIALPKLKGPVCNAIKPYLKKDKDSCSSQGY